ncbi:MAG: DUF2520 domain-containing protein [Chloroflexi bacterium]|nr:DUF2520 domain-containing protein [Chloroflexota bacterium]
MKIGFIGAGTVGTALAITLKARGYNVDRVASRSQASAERLAYQVVGCQVDDPQGVINLSDLVFVTTPDDVIPQVVSQGIWRQGQGVIHCSGAASLDILEPARLKGAWVGAFHPLQSFASSEQAVKNLPGSVFAIEAEDPLLKTLKEMALALGGTFVILGPGEKILYHAAAVFVSNYTVTLMKLATDLWSTFGVSTREATRALLPLLSGTVNNIDQVGLPRCLTGPIARGDLGTIRKHLDALEKTVPVLAKVYRVLGQETIPIALGKGKIDSARAQELKSLLRISKE